MVKIILHSLVVTAVCIFGSCIALAQNQNQLAAKLNTDNFSAFKYDAVGYGEKGKAIPAGKAPWTLKINKQGSKDASGAEQVSSIVLNRAGVVEEIFQADLPGHPAYFFSDLHRALILDGKIFYYAWKNGADIKYVLVPVGESFSGQHSEWKSKVEAAQNRVLEEQKNVRTEIASAKDKAEQAEKAANSLKGKSVRQIRVKWLETPAAVGHLTKLKYGIEAELSDGKVLKTGNMGGKLPWDDFDIEVSGAEFGEEMLTVWEDASKIPDDKVVVNVKSKHGAQTATIALDVTYTQPYVAKHEGWSYSGANGNHGVSLIVLAKADKTAQGKPVAKIEINDAQSGTTLHRLKLAPGTGLKIEAYGGKGASGGKDRRGYNGGNGGDVTVIQDPSITSLALVVNNKGGQGGNGGPGQMSGLAGKDGRYDNKKQPVSLSW
jgi:hypothetical protein